MAALAPSTELCPRTLSYKFRTERGLGAESRCHGTRAFPDHILMSRAEVGQGESSRSPEPWTQQVTGEGLASSSSHKEPKPGERGHRCF